ncbi:MAG: type II toxin-antitoxin system VapC family toxin [Anaerolinea sp.]|jgi:predicted nucleic acid-binding protein|nr:type II toxin-antitoxin system VapC family toxin [Anaerolinea sp.]
MADVLVDANFLIAIGYPRDRNHTKAKTFAAATTDRLLIPDVVLVEAMYNLQRLGGTPAAGEYARLLLTESTPFLSLTTSDYTRAVDILNIYQDVPLDFVDCCLTALAERLEITRICTFDRRDFMIIRPTHTDYFELLP